MLTLGREWLGLVAGLWRGSLGEVEMDLMEPVTAVERRGLRTDLETLMEGERECRSIGGRGNRLYNFFSLAGYGR